MWTEQDGHNTHDVDNDYEDLSLGEKRRASSMASTRGDKRRIEKRSPFISKQFPLPALCIVQQCSTVFSVNKQGVLHCTRMPTTLVTAPEIALVATWNYETSTRAWTRNHSLGNERRGFFVWCHDIKS